MRALRARFGNHQVDEENPYWISFSDIMAGLLVIFILAAIVFIMELMELQEELESKSKQADVAMVEITRAEEIQRSIVTEIVNELNNRNIPVRMSENDTVIIPEEVLTFESGKHELPKDEHLRSIVLDIGKVLYEKIKKDGRWEYLDTIFIEGHTDPVPVANDPEKGNWLLSSQRAISVWTFWNANMPEGDRLDEIFNHTQDKLFSVSGYAETRPAPCTNNDPSIYDPLICPMGLFNETDSLRKNRRIDIRITIRQPDIKHYDAVRRALN